MNGPAPGWQPDPTGRHEYRYWDGTKWSDDVSDGGVTANDPVAGAPDATQQQQFDPTQPGPATTPQPTYQAGYDPTGYDTSGQAPGYGSGGYGTTGGSAMGGAPLGGTPSGGYGGSGGSGGYPGYGVPPAQQPGSSGPSTGLLVGLGVLVLVLIGGIAFVLLGKDDDDETATDETTTTTVGGDPGTTAAPGTTTPPDDGGEGSNDAIVGAIAQGILEGSGGVLNEEEANCMAGAMVDEIGVDRLIELGLEANDGSSDPLDVLTTDEQDAVFNAMLGCVDAGTLAELPDAPGG